MKPRYEIRPAGMIKTPDGASTVFYDVWEVFDVDGEKRAHRNADVTVNSEAEAQAWIDTQSSR